MPKTTLYNYLTLAGTLPFIACALLPSFGVDAIYPLGALDSVASSYGLLIASFMAGVHWGQFLSEEKTTCVNLFVSSNAVALFVWFAYLVGRVDVAIVSQIIAFIVLLAIDSRLKNVGIIANDYWRIRITATAIVVLSLLLILAT